MKTNAEEIWKPVIDFPAYQISNRGRVRRVIRSNHGGIQRPFLALSRDWDGYLLVGLCRKGCHFSKKVARLVASHFVPNPLGKPHVNHINGIRHDNRSENLDWVTPKENCLHRTRVLKTAVGEQHYLAKLKDSDIPLMLAAYASGYSQTDIARIHCVSQSLVHLIIRGKAWKHIPR